MQCAAGDGSERDGVVLLHHYCRVYSENWTAAAIHGRSVWHGLRVHDAVAGKCFTAYTMVDVFMAVSHSV